MNSCIALYYYYYFFIPDTQKTVHSTIQNMAKDRQIQDKRIRIDYNSQSSTIHKKNVQILVYRLKRQWFHNLEVNLTALIAGFTSVARMLLNDSVNLHINLYMRFLRGCNEAVKLSRVLDHKTYDMLL